MSEYFTLEVETTNDPDTVELVTNHTLAKDGDEEYTSPEDGEIGSPVAQTLFFGVDGIKALRIVDESLFVTRQPNVTWELLIDDIRDALRDFFL